MCVPSGDHAAPDTAPRSRVTGVSVLVRRSRIQRSMCPLRSLENASCRPSGDHAGSSSTAESSVTCTGVPPTGRSQRSPMAMNAIARPSGETTGFTMPVSRCGSVGSSTRCAIGYVVRCSDTVAVNGMTAGGSQSAARSRPSSGPPGRIRRCQIRPLAVYRISEGDTQFGLNGKTSTSSNAWARAAYRAPCATTASLVPSGLHAAAEGTLSLLASVGMCRSRPSRLTTYRPGIASRRLRSPASAETNRIS